MEPIEQELVIKVYNTTPPQPPQYPSGLVPLTVVPNPGRKNRRAIMVKGVQKTISKTSLLGNFLPTGTLLTFEMILPSIYKNGKCTHVQTLMIHILLMLCSLSCFFFHFTDSFRGPDGTVYYGFVTPKGLSVFKPGIPVEVPKDDNRVAFTDFVHAFVSVLCSWQLLSLIIGSLIVYSQGIRMTWIKPWRVFH
ncbi:hypothetical protein PIB30_015958 [Stylosanthes scabra]|uniref:Uncharacterized protein n=1 Tax=Stylosanthes scabra TaxID=79078 RepID=A0ABU6V677_9FABA|nr:hypothetical protein [Stylosanthes scabra]